MGQDEVALGPKLSLLVGVVLAIDTLNRAGSVQEAFGLLKGVHGHILADAAFQKTEMMVAILRAHPDCPYDNDEEVACDVLRGLNIDPDTGMSLDPCQTDEPGPYLRGHFRHIH